jgi:alanine racemase
MNNLSWIEISKNNLKCNIKTIRDHIGKETILAPCVKANAYGHGLIETSKTFLEAGANWLCVNSIEEAKRLRDANIDCPILIIGYVDKSDLSKVIDLGVRIFLYDINHGEILSNLARERNTTAPVHIKVDTGMHRQGVLLNKAEEFTKKVLRLGGIKIEGVATHFANSDEPNNPSYFNGQLEKFKDISSRIKNIVGHDLITHCDKSASALLYHHKLSNLVRPGIVAYGHYPGKDVAEICLNKNIVLRPALAFKTKIAQIKSIPPDSFVGYGCTYRTTRPTKIATIPVGYYDGYDRGLSNRGHVIANSGIAPILGRICMNITIIDITDCHNIAEGDEVVLIGQKENRMISAEKIGSWTNTINYEVITRLRESIPRYYM